MVIRESSWAVVKIGGIGLIESIIALFIVLILFCLAMPHMSDLLNQTRLLNATYALYHAIQFTKSEAIHHNQRVDMVARHDNWQQGWQVKLGQQVRMEHNALSEAIAITTSFNTPYRHMISYGPSGRSRTIKNPNAPQVGHIRLSTGTHTRFIIINFLGRARICRPLLAKSQTCVE